ncbi:MAG: sulfatase-like hydrolase/transferase [Myxococcales bacterium]|nr:sulfatase-like hydrolase/transferase [Myxococcales bacterium]
MSTRMSAYGYNRPTTPHIARYFEHGARFTRAYTPGGYTAIAVPAIFRGVYPRRLVWTRVLQTNFLRLLRPPLRTPSRYADPRGD